MLNWCSKNIAILFKKVREDSVKTTRWRSKKYVMQIKSTRLPM